MKKQYGILFSHASETVIPGLVWGSYERMKDAVAYAQEVAQAQGVEYVIMTRSDASEDWIDPKTGLSAVDTIRARWVF